MAGNYILFSTFFLKLLSALFCTSALWHFVHVTFWLLLVLGIYYFYFNWQQNFAQYALFKYICYPRELLKFHLEKCIMQGRGYYTNGMKSSYKHIFIILPQSVKNKSILTNKDTLKSFNNIFIVNQHKLY